MTARQKSWADEKQVTENNAVGMYVVSNKEGYYQDMVRKKSAHPLQWQRGADLYVGPIILWSRWDLWIYPYNFHVWLNSFHLGLKFYSYHIP